MTFKETIPLKLRRDDELEIKEQDDGTTLVLIHFEAVELNHPKFQEGIQHAIEELGLPAHEEAEMEDNVYSFIMRKMRLLQLEKRLT